MTEITVLDRTETSTLLDTKPTESTLMRITDTLMGVIGTGSGVFVVGLNEGLINSLRTRMYRRNARVTVRKMQRGGETGHLLIATLLPTED
jgi:hypothetical protein